VPQDGLSRQDGEPHPGQSRAFMEMACEIQAAEEHSAADNWWSGQQIWSRSRTQQVAKADQWRL